MRVDIWSDIVCPWCYIGNARFSHALADFEHRDEVEVVPRSFELDPSIPEGRATPILDVLAGKYGMSQAQAQQAEARVAALAEARQRGLYTVGFAGYDGGAFTNNPNVDACFIVRSQSVHRIQESQALLGYQLWSATQQQSGDRGLGAA